MKINEIYPGIDQVVSNVDFDDFRDEVDTGITAENNKVFKYQSKTSNKQFLYAIKTDIIISFIVLWEINFQDTEYYRIQRTWTRKDYRMKGYATALYSALYSKLGLKLISDVEQGPGAKKLWKSLANIFNVKVINLHTGERKELSDITDSELYNKDENPDNDETTYALILEYELFEDEKYYEKYPNAIPRIKQGVVGDYLRYTHPDNKGNYE
jgi:hypothetical protein